MKKQKSLTEQLRSNPWMAATLILSFLLLAMTVTTIVEQSIQLIETELPGLEETCQQITGDINWRECGYCIASLEELNQSCYIIRKQ